MLITSLKLQPNSLLLQIFPKNALQLKFVYTTIDKMLIILNGLPDQIIQIILFYEEMATKIYQLFKYNNRSIHEERNNSNVTCTKKKWESR
jgi:hypothetical protein